MAKIKVTQIKSYIGYPSKQERTLHSLGLRHIGDTSIVEDAPQFRGMIRAVRHLVKTEEIK